MKTISYYLKKLIDLKKLLVTYLKEKGVSCDDTETFNTLIVKIESVVSPATNEVSLPDFSLNGCNLSSEELDDLISKLNLSNPSSNVSYKWANVPNLKKLCLKKNWNLTTVSSATDTFLNTPLEELDVSNIEFSVTLKLPTTLKKLDLTGTTFYSLPSFQGYKNLEEITNMTTLTLLNNPTTLQYEFQNCELLESINLQSIDLSKVTNISYMLYNTKSLNTFVLSDTFNLDNLSNTGLQYTFYNSNIVSDAFLTQLGLDTYDYKAKVLKYTFGCPTKKDDEGTYILNENLEVLDFSNSTSSFTFDYTVYENRHLKKLNLKNCTFYTNSYSYFIGAGSYYATDRYVPCFLEEVDLTNATIITTQSSNSFFAQLGGCYFEKYNITPTVIFDNTTIYYNNTLNDFMIRSYVEDIDLSNITLKPTLDISTITLGSFAESCPNLRSIKIRNNNLVFNIYAFASNCYSLETIDLDGIDIGGTTATQQICAQCSNLVNVTFGNNLGKSFTQKSNNYNYYTLSFSYAALLTYESLMDIINKLYDLNLTYDVANGGTLYTQKLVLGTTNLEKLSADDIAIATNKGWTVS